MEEKTRRIWCNISEYRIKYEQSENYKQKDYITLIKKEIAAYKNFIKYGIFYDPQNDDYIKSLKKKIRPSLPSKKKEGKVFTY